MEKNSQFFIPDTTREAAFELAERIRIQISQQPIYVYGKLPIFVQVSIGISYILQAITVLLKVCLKKQTMRSIKQSAKGVIEFLFLCNISKSSSSVMNFIQYLLFCHVC